MRIQWSHWKGHTRTNKKLVVKGQGLVIFVHRVLFLCVFFPLFCAFPLVIWFYMFHPFHKHTSACSSWNSISPYVSQNFILKSKAIAYAHCVHCAHCTCNVDVRWKLAPIFSIALIKDLLILTIAVSLFLLVLFLYFWTAILKYPYIYIRNQIANEHNMCSQSAIRLQCGGMMWLRRIVHIAHCPLYFEWTWKLEYVSSGIIKWTHVCICVHGIHIVHCMDEKNVLNNARYELMDRTYFLPDRPINRWPAYFGQTSTYACTLCNVKERIDVRAWSYACARTCALPSARFFACSTALPINALFCSSLFLISMWV